MKTVLKQVDFNLELFISFSYSDPFKTNVSNPNLRPFFYTWNRSRNLNQSWNRNLEQDHGSGSDLGKIIWFWFRNTNEWRGTLRTRLMVNETLGVSRAE